MWYREIVRSVQFLVRIATPDATRIVRRRGARTRVIRTRDRREVTVSRSCENVACARGYIHEASSSECYEPPRVRPNDCPSRDHGTHMFVIRSVYESRCLPYCLPLPHALFFFFSFFCKGRLREGFAQTELSRMHEELFALRRYKETRRKWKCTRFHTKFRLGFATAEKSKGFDI